MKEPRSSLKSNNFFNRKDFVRAGWHLADNRNNYGMKRYILPVMIFLAVPVATAQKQTIICEGSGVHCMTLDLDGMQLRLVKARNKPEITIKES